MKIKIEESPFGDAGKEYDGTLGMFQHFRLQLISYRNQNKTPDERAHLEADIAGYEEVIATGSEETARNFLKYKRDEKHRSRCANNLELNKWLKDNGHWKVEGHT